MRSVSAPTRTAQRDDGVMGSSAESTGVEFVGGDLRDHGPLGGSGSETIAGTMYTVAPAGKVPLES